MATVEQPGRVEGVVMMYTRGDFVHAIIDLTRLFM